MKPTIYILIMLLVGACGQHSQSVIRVDGGDEINKLGDRELGELMLGAVSGDRAQEIEELVSKGADVNMMNNEGLTLAMVAIKAPAYSSLEKLVELGADLGKKTDNREFNPAVDCFGFLQSQKLSEQVTQTIRKILNKEDVSVSMIENLMIGAIDFKNAGLIKWLLKKGVSPNYVEKSKSTGRPLHSALIYIFKLKGVEGDEFRKLKTVFDVLVSHPEIDVNLKVGRNTPLKRAKRKAKQEPSYQYMVDKLIELGASE